MSVTVKAFLYKEWDGNPVEIRRFPVDQDVSTSYAYLLQKIAQVFPSVKADKVAVAWVDGDGDRISISSDAELLEAMDQFDGTVFRIQIRDTSSSFSVESTSCSSSSTNAPHESSARQDKPAVSTGSREGSLHPGVVCDGCGGSIYGTRYKCLTCPDYDLCTVCKNKGYHNEHSMAAMEPPPPPGYPSPPAGYPSPPAGYHCPPTGHSWAPTVYPWPPSGYSCASSGYPCATSGNYWPPGGHPCTPSGYPWPPAGPGMTTGGSYNGGAANTNPPPSSSDQQKGLLHNIGRTVASILGPLGVIVDVVDDKKPPSEGAAPKEANNTSTAEEDQIQIAVAQLRSMGYEDEGGWLTELVKAKKGNVEQVLETLHPSQ